MLEIVNPSQNLLIIIRGSRAAGDGRFQGILPYNKWICRKQQKKNSCLRVGPLQFGMRQVYDLATGPSGYNQCVTTP